MTMQIDIPRGYGGRAPSCAALAAVACLGLAACGAPGGGGASRERVVSVYNWADFIGKTTVAEFEKATGIKVDYDTFDSDTTMEAKMLAGGSGYDVVSTSQNYFGRQIKAGAYREIDRELISNWRNIDPKQSEMLSLRPPASWA